MIKSPAQDQDRLICILFLQSLQDGVRLDQLRWFDLFKDVEYVAFTIGYQRPTVTPS